LLGFGIAVRAASPSADVDGRLAYDLAAGIGITGSLYCIALSSSNRRTSSCSPASASRMRMLAQEQSTLPAVAFSDGSDERDFGRDPQKRGRALSG